MISTILIMSSPNQDYTDDTEAINWYDTEVNQVVDFCIISINGFAVLYNIDLCEYIISKCVNKSSANGAIFSLFVGFVSIFNILGGNLFVGFVSWCYFCISVHTYGTLYVQYI